MVVVEDVENTRIERRPMVDHRGPGDPNRGVFARRLDNHGKAQVHSRQLALRRNQATLRHRNPAGAQDLFHLLLA